MISKYNFYFFLLFLGIFSLLNNGLPGILGLKIHHLIGLLYLFLEFKSFRLKISILEIEIIYWFFLFYIISWIFPFHDTLEKYRTITQTFSGRYSTQIVGFVLELIFGYFAFFMHNKDNKRFNQYIIFASYLTIFIGYCDLLFLNKAIYTYVLGDTHVLGRLTALSIEPRMFSLGIVYIHFYLKIAKVKFRYNWMLPLAVISTFSLSSILILFVLELYLVLKNKKKVFRNILVGIFLTTTLLIIISKNEIIYNRFETRIIALQNLSEADYFPIFGILEIFDRTSANALFYNWEYLITGFGPNTISIVASYYIPLNYLSTYNIINSPPHTGLINILSRSGIIFLLMFLMKHRKSKNKVFLYLYLLQYNFLFYTFYYILFSKNDRTLIDNNCQLQPK